VAVCAVNCTVSIAVVVRTAAVIDLIARYSWRIVGVIGIFTELIAMQKCFRKMGK